MICPICKTDLPHPVYLGDGIGTCKGVTVDGWIEKAARSIVYEHGVIRPQDEASIASIITTHAEPLVAMLREARREHQGEQYACEAYGFGSDPALCDCGASVWNARIDAVLAGNPQKV